MVHVWSIRGRGAVSKGTVPEVIHIQALHSYDNGLLAEGEADGVRCRMVVDTGANVTLVHPKIIKLAQPPRSQGQPVDNLELRTVTQRKINIHIGHTSVMHTVYIANIEDDVILGLDFLRRYRCVNDPVNNLLRIGHEDIMLENRNQNDHMRCQLICASTLEIPPMTEILVPVFCATSSSKKLMIVEPQLLNGCTPGLIVTRAVMHVDNQETALRIMNVATTPRMISKNTVSAFCEPVGAGGLTGCHEDNCNSLKYSQISSHLQELFLKASEHLQVGDENASSWSTDTLRRAQEEDTDLQPIIQWLKEGRRPDWQTIAPYSATIKAYWALWDTLRLDRGVLFRLWESPDGCRIQQQLILPKIYYAVSHPMTVLQRLPTSS
ncbi:hypothetical protein CBL_12093 [Carabus blaptoides fortunei]